MHKAGYKCSICFKIFDRPALLQRHLAKHTGKKPFKCSLCSYQTPNKANAKRHIEKKHPDVQEGSILFVTDDGEQIQMEVVSKGVRDVEQRLSSASSPSIGIVKSSADSTSFGSSLASALKSDTDSNSIRIPLSSSITLPRSRSVSDASSTTSSSPPGHLFVGPIASVFDATDDGSKSHGLDKRRKITHSIDVIMKQHAESHFTNNNNVSAGGNMFTPATCCNPGPAPSHGGNQASLSKPENMDLVQYAQNQNHNHPSINELHMGSYCSANWSHPSSLLPLNNDGAARNNAHPLGFLNSKSTNTFASSDSRNQGSFVFRQCAHGCWHHVDNQAASDISPSFQNNAASSSFVPTHFCLHQNQDLRSSSSSISQQTENSSIISSKSEDEDSDIIDVVGDDDESGDDSSTKFRMLSSICEGLGISTAEIPSPPTVEGSSGHFDSPPVESALRQSSFTRSGSREGQDASSERYVPKKLRIARGHYK